MSNTFEIAYDARLQLTNDGVTSFITRLTQDLDTENVHVKAIAESYMSLLGRGGKRLRGVLAVTGYELAGGRDAAMITEVAGAIEALHAYLLVNDDVADESPLRRGGPTAHVAAAQQLLLLGAAPALAAKIGSDTAQHASFYAQHHAQSVLLELDVPPARKIRALRIMNAALARTGLGQILDMTASLVSQPNETDIMEVAERKTAYYSFLMPLQMGAALGGWPDHQLAVFEPYALHAGLAFQLRDDLIGLYGDELTTGKPRNSDLVEGKITLLMLDALTHATPDEQHILRSALGDHQLTDTAFEQCLKIITNCGAQIRSEQLILSYTQKAITALAPIARKAPEHAAFLEQLTTRIARRDS